MPASSPQELQRQREAADARSSALRGLLREAAGQLGELRARHRRNVEAWLVLRADTAVQLTAVQEQAGRLVSPGRVQAAYGHGLCSRTVEKYDSTPTAR